MTRPVSAIIMPPDWPRWVICLVTDRHRLLDAIGRPHHTWEPFMLEQIEGAVQGGVDVIQIRERDLAAGVLAQFVTPMRRIDGRYSVRIVVEQSRGCRSRRRCPRCAFT